MTEDAIPPSGTTASRPLVLGSTSRYRRELLERLHVPFEVVSPEVEVMKIRLP